MQQQFENLNVIVPRKHLSFNARRSSLEVKLNVSFSYTNPEDVEVFWITATRATHPHIYWEPELYAFIDSYAKEYVTNLFENITLDEYETSLQ